MSWTRVEVVRTSGRLLAVPAGRMSGDGGVDGDNFEHMETIAPNKPLIAWIDDDAEYQQLVKEWLRPKYDVAAFDSAESFLDELDALEPDLLLLDVKLPGPDGFALSRRIAREPRLRDVPVLFLTSCADDDTFIKHLDTRAAGLLTKPVEKKELLAKIGELMDGRRLASPAWVNA